MLPQRCRIRGDEHERWLGGANRFLSLQVISLEATVLAQGRGDTATWLEQRVRRRMNRTYAVAVSVYKHLGLT